MCTDIGSWSRGCAFYSIMGGLFTGWCGLMIHTQPFFIKGIDDAVKARTSALGAMAMFLFTLCASLYGITYDTKKKSETLLRDGILEEEYNLNDYSAPAYGTNEYISS